MAIQRRVTLNYSGRQIDQNLLRFYNYERSGSNHGKTNLVLELEGWDESPTVTRVTAPKIFYDGLWVSRIDRVAQRNVTLKVEVFDSVVDLLELRHEFGANLIRSNNIRIRVLTNKGAVEKNEYLTGGYMEEGLEWESNGESAIITIPIVFPNPVIYDENSSLERL